MTLDLHVNGYSWRQLLASPPRISDQANGVCRSLELTVKAVSGADVYLGQPVELWYAGKCWFFGFVFKRGYNRTDQQLNLTVHDPLFFWKKNDDDYYIKNMTATQGFQYLAQKVGTPWVALEATGAVFPALYYEGGAPEKIAADLIARTYQANGRKFWFRYQPDADQRGLILFERRVPELVWAFQVGINLTGASVEESIEETATVVKLINRDTGKVVIRKDNEALRQFGHMVHFEEVDKDHAATMEKAAEKKLKELSRIGITMSIEGINPNQVMPQFYSGDVIYIEDDFTGIIGAKYIRNITQTLIGDNLVEIGIDVIDAPDIPAIEYEDAAKNPATERSKQKDTDKKDKGVQENAPHSKEIDELINKYDLGAKK